MTFDTIAAIATARGEGAVSMVRISGEASAEILEKIFTSDCLLNPREMIYGHVIDPKTSEVIDETLSVFMPKPKTYTKEDVVEIFCHGGYTSANRILELILRYGARLAEPGEFTLRAFLSGRIDLIQAESVADLVKAKTSASFNASLSQLQGHLSSKVKEVRDELLQVLAHISVCVDYPEEDIEEISFQTIKIQCEKSIREIELLLKNSESGKLLREGAKVAIVGKPNVGKSTLMNVLLEEDRTIVTDVAGTTRDSIEESFSVKGIPVRLIDTAGIREAIDQVEKIGIERSKKILDTADLIIALFDCSSEFSDEDKEMLKMLDGKNVLYIVNKTDLPANVRNISDHIDQAMYVSLTNDAIREEIINCLADRLGAVDFSDDLVTNTRHISLLRRSKEMVASVLEQIAGGMPLYDLLEVDLRDAVTLLGEITGETTGNTLINEIFSKFCLGK